MGSVGVGLRLHKANHSARASIAPKIGQDALADNAKKDKKLKNRNTLIKILGAAVAVLVGVIAVK